MLQTAGLEQRCGQGTANNNYMGSMLVTKVTSEIQSKRCRDRDKYEV
jgi:hypothetical protein